MKARTAEQFIHDLAEMSLETLREQCVILGKLRAQARSPMSVLLALFRALVGRTWMPATMGSRATRSIRPCQEFNQEAGATARNTSRCP